MLTLRDRQDKFTYDANGNQTTRLVDGVSYILAYDEENRIETVTDTQASQTWTFHYDGNGTRVRQVNPDGSQLLLLNGGRYHVEIAADSTESTTRYYSIAGQRPAMRNNDGSINYLLGDHLGSVSTVVDASGQIISQSRYLPFGELLWKDGDSPTDYSYTGQRSLSDIGLMDYNARFYDPMLGRFTSPDSIVPDPGSVIGYNRYAYVNNNPMRYTDPNGFCIAEDGSINGDYPPGSSGLCYTPDPNKSPVIMLMNEGWLPSSDAFQDENLGTEIFDAYFTLVSITKRLGYVPNTTDILRMTAGTEYFSYISYSSGLRSLGQEGIARNYYEACGVDGCQGDEIYHFMCGFQPWWGSPYVIGNDDRTNPESRATNLIKNGLLNNFSGTGKYLGQDIRNIVDYSYAVKKGWSQGKVSDRPWQWYGPLKPIDKDTTGVYMLSVDIGNGYYFWVFSAAQDSVFNYKEWTEE